MPNTQLQNAFVEQCRELESQAKIVRELIFNQRANLWCCLPLFDHHKSGVDLSVSYPTDDTWLKLADTLTDIWMDPVTPQHGILVCDSLTLLQALHTFNTIKQSVARLSQSLKKYLLGATESEEEFGYQGESLQSYALVRDEFLSKGRDRKIHMLLRDHHVEQLNFKKATKLIKVTEPNVSRFRYVWSKTNHRKRVISGAELLTLASHYRHRLQNERLALFVEEDMAKHKIGPATKLIRLAFTRPALKANYKFSVADGQGFQWGHCLASGIVVVPQDSIPAVIWQSEPSEAEVERARSAWKAKSTLDLITIAGNLEIYHER